jgi:hypothetical protein
MLLYALTIFLSAFLLFQVQPLIARIILPWFGGSAAVWTTCMLFFQVALLAGYLYAHLLARRLAARAQSYLHTALLVASVLLLPIMPSPAWKPTGSDHPTLAILGLLAAAVGVPYLMLSTTGPLLQAWYARERSGALPYRFFALSNLGSMLALLSYPVLVEPFLPVHRQAQIWSVAYIVFAALCLLVTWRRAAAAVSLDPIEDAPAPRPGTHLYWVLLPACASALLLAVTTHLTEDIAAIPFLWVLPLSLYLLSFILCFDTRLWYRRGIFLPALAIALAGMAYMLWSNRIDLPLVATIAIWAAALFICCMVCHGELARLKPDPRYLTSFYLMISLGGALGGIFVGLFAPAVFRGYFELPITVAAIAALALLVLYRDPRSYFHQARTDPLFLSLVAAVLILFVVLSFEVRETIAGYRVMARNFYGTLRVSDSGHPDEEDSQRKLTNGAINHGEQWLHPLRRREPTGYYCAASGVVRGLLQANRSGSQRVGVIGLGAGVLSVFARSGDHYTFYEINPLVVQLARSEFTLLKESPGATDIVLGDGRLSLERQPSQQFDLLAVDAFSSDSIPIHLLTKEAFGLYFRHLKSSGVLGVHVSNRYLDLAPMVLLEASTLGKDALVVETEEEEDTGCYATTWVLVAAQRGFFAQPAFQGVGTHPPVSRSLRLWTDDYSNLLGAIQ